MQGVTWSARTPKPIQYRLPAAPIGNVDTDMGMFLRTLAAEMPSIVQLNIFNLDME